MSESGTEKNKTRKKNRAHETKTTTERKKRLKTNPDLTMSVVCFAGACVSNLKIKYVEGKKRHTLHLSSGIPSTVVHRIHSHAHCVLYRAFGANVFNTGPYRLA